MKSRQPHVVLVTWVLLFTFETALAQQPLSFPKIDRRPAPMSFDFTRKIPLSFVPKFDHSSTNPAQADVQSYRFVDLDLRQSLDDLLYLTFDTRTVWPARLPAEFGPGQILELGKTPGLGIGSLHSRGITGKGVGIGIVDQPLLVSHQEYAAQLRLYEEQNIVARTPAQMHAPATASIAVGKTVGVAPEADLYFIALWNGDGIGTAQFTFNFKYPAQGIRRLIALNRELPPERRIRVISISVGWMKGQNGYDDIVAACTEAMEAGIAVFSCTEGMNGRDYYGLGRSPRSDPNDFRAYEPPIYASIEGIRQWLPRKLLVPMDSRVLASPCGDDVYVLYRTGGFSWCPPYLAGVYALAAQVDPAMTPDRFWKIATTTARAIKSSQKGQEMTLSIIDPVALINSIEDQRRNSTR